MAADIRTKVLNPIYDYMRLNKLDVNYVPDGGYMPRLLDTTLAIDNLSHFKYGVGNTQESKGDDSRGAYHLYKNVIYKNELGPFDLGNAD